MAISVDTVYQRVLTLANKEQRGYITPQEFNLLANQAQTQIFESYFYTKNARDRTEEDRSRQIDETDISELISRKLGPFLSVEMVNQGTTFPSNIEASGQLLEVFQTGRVFYNDNVCRKVGISEARAFQNSTRHAYPIDALGPIYIDNLQTGRDILVYSGSPTAITGGVTVECFRAPAQVNWGYVVVNEKALYNANISTDFELHRGEVDTIVLKILELAGIVINKVGLADSAATRVSGEQTMQNA